MPFASKFRAMMELPFAGDMVDGFCVESIDVSHRSGALGYAYSVHIVLRGPGGQQGVRRALKPYLSMQPTTFSGYGNPYQLWFGKPAIESLGDKRYAVHVKGAGARIALEQDLDRFLTALDTKGQLAEHLDRADLEALIETYLKDYRAEVKRTVDRYRHKLNKG